MYDSVRSTQSFRCDNVGCGARSHFHRTIERTRPEQRTILFYSVLNFVVNFCFVFDFVDWCDCCWWTFWYHYFAIVEPCQRFFIHLFIFLIEIGRNENAFSVFLYKNRSFIHTRRSWTIDSSHSIWRRRSKIKIKYIYCLKPN